MTGKDVRSGLRLCHAVCHLKGEGYDVNYLFGQVEIKDDVEIASAQP